MTVTSNVSRLEFRKFLRLFMGIYSTCNRSPFSTSSYSDLSLKLINLQDPKVHRRVDTVTSLGSSRHDDHGVPAWAVGTAVTDDTTRTAT